MSCLVYSVFKSYWLLYIVLIEFLLTLISFVNPKFILVYKREQEDILRTNIVTITQSGNVIQ